MSAYLNLKRVGPLCTIQDAGRAGHLRYGVSASGPMDCSAWALAGAQLRTPGKAGLELTEAGLEFQYQGSGPLAFGWAGGRFRVAINGQFETWPGGAILDPGSTLAITPGAQGNYGYVRMAAKIEVPEALDSLATNTIVGLGGLDGRALKGGDHIPLSLFEDAKGLTSAGPVGAAEVPPEQDRPIRVVWGIHADLFEPELRSAFCEAPFAVSRKLDRMGIRLTDLQKVFSDANFLSLTSDSVVPGDIQILGDGTPIILMRDHQPTGGYPRIATVVSADLDRIAQMRPGAQIRFQPVTVAHAQHLAKGRIDGHDD